MVSTNRSRPTKAVGRGSKKSDAPVGYRVMAQRCDQCLIGPNKIVDSGRVKELLKACRAKDSFFVCHKTKDVCCKGFFDTQDHWQKRVAEACDRVIFVKEG